MTREILLNVGCGSVFHPDWLNLDTDPSHSSVRRWDARSGLPFGEGQVAVCYVSHMLEHLTRQNAVAFLRECRRVLRIGGILRVVVPDLEAIARHYLRLLDEADQGSPTAAHDYDWIMLELLDQSVRKRSGGEMQAYLAGGKVKNPDFVISRIGLEAEKLIRGPHEQAAGGSTLKHKWRRMREVAASMLASLALGRDGYRALREGLFRRSGQVHLWMYDRYSLRRLLEHCGFQDVARCSADESRIPGFAGYELDCVGGRIRKPDSLFMEAVKP